MQIVYIHGANATPDSFNYLRQNFSDGKCLSYDSDNGFKTNLEKMYEEISMLDNIVFIGHSLGGIYALHLANLMPEKIRKGITLSAPYGGHSMANYARFFFPFNKLLSDISPNSWPIKQIENIEIRWPWCNVVTILGNIPWLDGPNDGVITIESMKHRKDMTLIALNCNHYEVVQHPAIIEIIKKEIEK